MIYNAYNPLPFHTIALFMLLTFVAVSTTSAATANISTNQSSFVTGDSLSLSASITAEGNAGVSTDIYVAVITSTGVILTLNNTLNWELGTTPFISGFLLADAAAPNFYTLPNLALSTGNYTFALVLTIVGTDPLNSGNWIASGTTMITFTQGTIPGALLTMNGTGLDTTTQYSVRFSNNTGYSVDVPAIEATTSAVTVAIPPYINLVTGAFEAGIVNVQLIQSPTTAIQNFQIGNLPTPAVPPGTVTLDFLNMAKRAATEHLTVITPNLLPELNTALNNQISNLTTLIAQVQSVVNNSASSFTLGSIGGIPLVFGSSDLLHVDHMIIGMLMAQAGRTTIQADILIWSDSPYQADQTVGNCATQEAANYIDALLHTPGMAATARISYGNAYSNCTVQGTKKGLQYGIGSATASVGFLAILGMPPMALALPSAAINYLTVMHAAFDFSIASVINDPTAVRDGLNRLISVPVGILEGLVLPSTLGNIKSLFQGVSDITTAFTNVPSTPPPPSNAFITVGATPLGGGSVTGSGVNCPGVCTATYPLGTQITLTAMPADGFYLKSWGGACTGRGACVLTMDSDKGVIANFLNIITWSVNASWSAPGIGAGGSCSRTITLPVNGGSAGGIDCGDSTGTLTTTRSSASISGFGNASGSLSGVAYTCSGSGGGTGGITETLHGFTGGAAIAGSTICAITDPFTGAVTNLPSSVSGSFTVSASK